jgi:hypothetical protein
MHRNDFLKAVMDIDRECYELLATKNSDYCPRDDAFAVYALGEKAGVGRVECQILAEILRRIMRISNLLQNKQPHHESVSDSLNDLINNAKMLKIYLKEDKTPRVWAVRGGVDPNKDIHFSVGVDKPHGEL